MKYAEAAIPHGSNEERVSGPVDGYFIATYAYLGRQFLGVAKLCCIKPRSFWSAADCGEPSCCQELADGVLQTA